MELTEDGIFAAFKACFKKLHASFKKPSGGTTATVAFVDKIFISNTGDSRAFLISKND